MNKTILNLPAKCFENILPCLASPVSPALSMLRSISIGRKRIDTDISCGGGEEDQMVLLIENLILRHERRKKIQILILPLWFEKLKKKFQSNFSNKGLKTVWS